MSSSQLRAFRPLGVNKTVLLAVTAASLSLPIPDVPFGTRALRVANIGTQTVFLDFVTTVGVASVTTSIPLLANTVEIFTIGNDITALQAIAPAIGSTLYITYGEGL